MPRRRGGVEIPGTMFGVGWGGGRDFKSRLLRDERCLGPSIRRIVG